jgi:RNA-binding protein YhbY
MMITMTPPQPDRDLIATTWNEPVMIQVGKGGISEGLIAEAKRIMKKHRYVKVKLLRSTGADKHTKGAIFEEFCSKIGATLAGIRGNTAVIYKLRK